MVAAAEKVRLSQERLEAWIAANGFAGYDPYDLRGTSFYVRLLRLPANASLPWKIVRRALYFLEGNFPMAARRLLGVRKRVNAKGMGLFARAYLNLYALGGEERHRAKALECLDWLEENVSSGYAGPCWGYPFDWEAELFIPAGTPSSVVSSVVGDAFWTAYQVLGDSRYLEVCEGICRFFLTDLNVDRMEDGSWCFSYTPLDELHVHNASLFVAEFLARVGAAAGRPEFVEAGARAGAYALREQNPDGSLFYWGRVQNHYAPDHIDHYHSGFEIRALYGLWKATGGADFGEAARRYHGFYIDKLVEKRDGATAPRMNPRSFYPVNVHSCAEAILLNASLPDFPDAEKVLPELCEWVIARMQTPEGCFRYRIRLKGGRELREDIPYIRWGQGWMLLALSQARRVLEAPDASKNGSAA